MKLEYTLPIRCKKCGCLLGYAKHNIKIVKSAKYFSSMEHEGSHEILVMLCEKCVNEEGQEQ